MRYNNYHKHTTYSSAIVPDTHIQMREYFERAKKLGHTNFFTTEHGFAGSVFEALDLGKEYGIKVIFAMEIYVVEDNKEKDNSNYHMMVIARNNKARRQINAINSDAHEFGFYYKPRWSLKDVLKLNPNDVWITNACVAGVLRDDKIMSELVEHFGESLFIEVQSHNHPVQIEHNKKAIDFANEYGLKLIHANDSHYIYPSQGKDRLEYLKGKGITYDDEDSFLLDYPSYDDILERYGKQGVLDEAMVKSALENTLTFDNAEEIDIDHSIKMPTIYPELSLDERYRKLAEIITEKWKEESKNIPQERHKEYMDAIKFEMDIVRDTNDVVHTADYFLLNYEIIKLAKEKYGGVLTSTGRGSSPSFYINKLLGFTEMDRLDIDVPLMPTRFISTSRLIGAKSIPDLDQNCADQEPFMQASRDILGENSVYWMLAYGTMKESEAFRNVCRNDELDYSIINKVAKDMKSYQDDEEWIERFKRAKIQEGAIVSVSRHPCAALMLSENIREEIGLIRSGEDIVCAITSLESDNWKYLKDDFLKVKVVEIIDKVFNLVDEDKFNVKTLVQKLDEKVWKLYEDGITATLNQAATDLGRSGVMRYKPKNYKELSAFVAAIRPGFKSLVNVFLDRESHSTGVEIFDEMLKDTGNFMLYQELTMKYLSWLGIPDDETYTILKKISKKSFKEGELETLHETLKSNWIKINGTVDGFEKSWQVVEDSSLYQFSSSHSASVSFDSLYQAYLKSHYPYEYYKVVLDMYESDIDTTRKLSNELQYFGISLQPARFGKSAGHYTINKDQSAIYKGIGSIKGLNSTIGDELYDLRNNDYKDFYELLIDIHDHTSANKSQIDTLIKLDFFSSFGGAKYLQHISELFEYRGRAQLTKSKIIDTPFSFDVLLANGKETEKQVREIDFDKVIKDTVSTLDTSEDYTVSEKIKFQQEHLGYFNLQLDVNNSVCVVVSLEKKYTPKAVFQSMGNGKRFEAKVPKKIFDKSTKEGSIVKVLSIKEQFGWNPPDENGNFTRNYNKKEFVVESYKLLNEAQLREEVKRGKS